jgi:uncharacterized protein (DUF488 family)
VRLYTLGHGTLLEAEFTDLLEGVGLRGIVDVRSYPGSRRNPQFGRAEMQRWLPDAGIGYAWLKGLGGRRRPKEGSKHLALRHEAFRAYADHMETAEFSGALESLLTLAGADVTAVMCSESLWWRCHRRLLADHLVLVRGIEVLHVMHDGRVTPHRPTEGVRPDGGALVYDVGVTTRFAGLGG